MSEGEPIGGPATPGQVGCLLAYLAFVFLWAYAELLYYKQRGHEIVRQHDEDDKTEAELVPVVVHVAPEGIPSAQGPVSTPTSPSAVAAQSGKLSKSPLLRLVALDHAALAASREALRAAVELGTIVFWFYVADRTTAMAAGPKQYMRDVFLFLFLVLTMVAGTYTMRPARAPVLAHRQQTEEWKGWMQVLFLLYHYYEAKEAYNAIRVFIASYVWMTGFGNFSYYHRSKDFSLGRFCQMLWRLNLLATLCCFALDNQYMLYYICPMHTLFTIMVYAALALWRRGNESAWGVWTKLAASLLLVVGVWEHKPVFYAIFRPFTFVLAYTDPRRPTPDALHEWYFRTGLDRYVWIHGMACAHLHPRLDAWLKKVDAEPPRKRRAIRSALAGASIVALVLWYKLVFRLPKLEYNVLHPYTSWIPITGYLVLRNLTPPLRLHSMGLYGWLGCITLETYVSQYHTWLLSKVPNSQPIYLLCLLPGYPLLNYALVTAIFVFLSHRLFILTGVLRDALIPHDDDRLLGRNLIAMALAVCVAWMSGFMIVQLSRTLT